MSIGDGGWHEYGGFITGIAEHESLIACSLILGTIATYSLIDVGGLLADGIDKGTEMTVEAHLRGVVAYITYGLAYAGLQI